MEFGFIRYNTHNIFPKNQKQPKRDKKKKKQLKQVKQIVKEKPNMSDLLEKDREETTMSVVKQPKKSVASSDMERRVRKLQESRTKEPKKSAAPSRKNEETNKATLTSKKSVASSDMERRVRKLQESRTKEPKGQDIKISVNRPKTQQRKSVVQLEIERRRKEKQEARKGQYSNMLSVFENLKNVDPVYWLVCDDIDLAGFWEHIYRNKHWNCVVKKPDDHLIHIFMEHPSFIVWWSINRKTPQQIADAKKFSPNTKHVFLNTDGVYAWKVNERILSEIVSLCDHCITNSYIYSNYEGKYIMIPHLLVPVKFRPQEKQYDVCMVIEPWYGMCGLEYHKSDLNDIRELIKDESVSVGIYGPPSVKSFAGNAYKGEANTFKQRIDALLSSPIMVYVTLCDFHQPFIPTNLLEGFLAQRIIITKPQYLAEYFHFRGRFIPIKKSIIDTVKNCMNNEGLERIARRASFVIQLLGNQQLLKNSRFIK